MGLRMSYKIEPKSENPTWIPMGTQTLHLKIYDVNLLYNIYEYISYIRLIFFMI